MAKYALFLGCYIPAMQPFAEASFRKIASLIDLDLIDIKGATCCPVPEITRLMDYDSWITIAARNLALADEMKNDIVVLCNGCWETLYEAREQLLHNEDLKNKVNLNLKLLGKTFTGESEVKHYVEVLVEDIGLDKLKENVKVDLSDIKVAIHPGCKLYKSEGEKLANYMFDIINALGVKIIDYGIERVCCGYPLMLASVDKAIKERSKWKLDEIKNAGADLIVVACPACYDQFEKAQLTLKDEGLEYNLPVLHLSELIAIALGFKPKEIGIDLHGIPCQILIDKFER
ncbi:MAG: hypothetical protein DRJ21_01915 [Candidatus Methanomethylicota archaeon]|uniref:Cysteine-rich domain-containing protein n=1 Tax=Thermoproteota archaeon TaxID=2056631 RepID=A0A497ESI0_9CREN|nr:MAG: hypothetical protein DRJ21_01915 [Candidatus Verstraetearchaeota archaeon]